MLHARRGRKIEKNAKEEEDGERKRKESETSQSDGGPLETDASRSEEVCERAEVSNESVHSESLVTMRLVYKRREKRRRETDCCAMSAMQKRK